MNAPRTVALGGALGLALGSMGWAQDPVANQELRFATIAAEEAELLCFASIRSPGFEDRLTEGQVVKVGDKVGDYREVVVPLGPIGYVHKKFASEPVDGMIEASASNVSFRYRPKSSEAPAVLMPGGAKLFYVGEEGDWWKVRNPGAPTYLAEADLKIFDTANPTLEQAWAELDKVQREEWSSAMVAREQQAAAAAALEKQRGQLEELATRFAAVAMLPTAEQDYTPISADLSGLKKELPPESTELASAEELEREISVQERYIRALAAMQPVPTRNVAEEILRPEVTDPLGRFDAVGWLRHEEPMRGPSRFTLEKGGRLLFVVTCRSSRYDMSMFDGYEIGIAGSKTQPDINDVRQIDILKLEVLQTPR